MTNVQLPWSPPGSGWSVGTRSVGWLLYVPQDGNDLACISGTLPADGNAYTWKDVTDGSGRRHDITVTATATGNGPHRTFSLHVANNTDLVIASAKFPVVQGISVPAGRTLSALTWQYFGASEHGLWPVFEWSKAYYGTMRPTWMGSGNPTAPFAVMQDGHEALAVSVAGPTTDVVTWSWELDPGYADTIGDRVPSDAALTFSAVHLLDLAPGQQRELTGIRFDHAHGGWQAALAPYRASRRDIPAAIHPAPDWAAEPHSWYQVQLSSSAGERRYRFSDLPELARQCRDAGVAVLHVIGWNDGGQDRGNPSHDADPRLGGATGLRSAIAACQALGVRVVLFSKFTWADESTGWFRNELRRSAIRNPYGDYYPGPAYEYLTPHQLLGVSPRRLIPMCFLHEDYLRVCEHEFDKIVATGADGMLFDEAFHHGPALLCYDTSHGHRAGASVFAGDPVLAGRLSARLPAGREDFLFAAETLYEGLQPSYHLSYIRSHFTDHVPLTRYVTPELRMLTTVSGFDDRNQINQALAYGYLICYEPFHFKGALTDMPLTTGYGRAADDLRRELAAWLWDGRYEGDAPVEVMTGQDGARFASATWVNESGSPLHLIANYETDPISIRLNAPTGESRTVETPWCPATTLIAVPPRTLSLVREKTTWEMTPNA
jgi:sugar phosphate isomerase/epimerase